MDEPQEPLAALHTEATPPQNAANNDGGEPTEYTESVTETPETTPPTDRQKDAGDSHRATKPWWKKWSRWKRVFEVGAFMLGIYFAHIYSGQLVEMRRVTQANTDAVRLAFESLELSRSQFNRSMTQTITQTTSQYQATQAGITSARAAVNAAHTAGEALHISERAYLTIEDPSVDFATKSLRLPITNSGHIPARGLIVTAHQAFYRSTSPSEIVNLEYPTDVFWQRSSFPSAAPGNHDTLALPFNLLDQTQYLAGTQLILVAGEITYNDGFDGTPLQTWEFCFRSTYQTTMKMAFIGPCDVHRFLPILQKIDGYPNNERKDSNH